MKSIVRVFFNMYGNLTDRIIREFLAFDVARAKQDTKYYELHLH